MIDQRWLKIALVAEVPVLIVTLALLAWAIYALNDAATYIGLLADSPFGHNKHQAKYGLDLGTQIVTLTTTFTGRTQLYSPVIVHTTQTWFRSETVVLTRTRDVPLGITSGTITAEQTTTLYPGWYGTAPYGDAYSQAQANPSTLKMWSSGEYDAYLSSAGLYPSTSGIPPALATESSRTTAASSVPTLMATQAPQKRDGSWSEGYTYHAMKEGLFEDTPDNEYFLPLWLGAFSCCLGVIALRLIATVTYVSMAPRKSTAAFLLYTAAFGLLILCGCGIAAWSVFVPIQNLGAPEVLATFVFYILSTLTTVSVLVAGAFELQHHRKRQKLMRQEILLESERIESERFDGTMFDSEKVISEKGINEKGISGEVDSGQDIVEEEDPDDLEEEEEDEIDEDEIVVSTSKSPDQQPPPAYSK
jgi:hypothetical protein